MFAHFGDSNNSQGLLQADIYFAFLFLTYANLTNYFKYTINVQI